MPHYLTNNQLDNLLDHKYVTCELTPLDKYMNVFWNSLVNKVPHVIIANIDSKP
jgi:hypothetical protein